VASRASIIIRAQDKTAAAFASVNKRLHSVDASVTRGSKSFERYAVVAAAAGAAFAIREAASFEKKMLEISTLLDDTSGMDVMTASIRQLSLQFGEMPVDQARATYNIISAGATSTAQAMQLLQASNKLALGGVTDVATAADGLTSILNSYGDEAGSATDVSDMLFVTMRAGKTTIGELSGSIGNVADLASQAGVGLDELLAATATVTQGGQKTSVVLQGLRQVIATTLKPSSEATKLAAELGLEFNAQALAAKGLAGFLEDVKEKTGGSTEKMSKLFGSVEALVPIMALAGTRSDVFAKILADMGKSAGETEKAVKKMETSGDIALKRLGVLGTDAANSIGNQLLPGMVKLADMMVGPVSGGISGIDSSLFTLKASAFATLNVLAKGLFAVIAPLKLIEDMQNNTANFFGSDSPDLTKYDDIQQALFDFTQAMDEGGVSTLMAKDAAEAHAKAVYDEAAAILSRNDALIKGGGKGDPDATDQPKPGGESLTVSQAVLDAQKIIDIHSLKFQQIQDLGEAAFGDDQAMLLAKQDADILALDAERQRFIDATTLQIEDETAREEALLGISNYYDELEIERAQQTADQIGAIEQAKADAAIELEKKKNDSIANLRDKVTGQGIALLQMFAGKNKVVALLLTAIHTAQAVRDISIQAASASAQVAALGSVAQAALGARVAAGDLTALAQMPVQAAATAAQLAAINTTAVIGTGLAIAGGVAQGVATQAGGGSDARPTFNANPATGLPAQSQPFSSAPAQRPQTNIIIQGNVIGSREFVTDTLLPILQDEIANNDVQIIEAGSRQALELMA